MEPTRRILVAGAVLAVLAALVGCGGAARGSRAAVGLGAARVGAGSTAGGVASNILREDYAGSQACASCHARIHAAWLTSPMHRMTRLPEGARIRAPFDGAQLSFKNDRARLETDASGARVMRVTSAELGDHTYRVTKVIGGRYREDFAGVELGIEAGTELILPVSFVFETRSFRLKGYSVMVGERPGLRAAAVWSATCVFCHNTNPYFDSVWGALYGPGAPAYQGEVVDAQLPASRRASFEITDEAGLASAVRRERAFVSRQAGEVVQGGEAPDGSAGARRALLGQSIRALRRDFAQGHLLEIGIGCESCHGGAREHVEKEDVVPDFVPRSRFLRVLGPAGQDQPTRAEAINRVCARCHQVLFSRYSFTWEGGVRGRGQGSLLGGSSITSGEARDFLLGGCSRQMACTACHDPHAEDQKDKLTALASTSGNHVCTTCHASYAAPAALARHTRHDPAGAGASCVGCHMPRKNMGLGYALTRYHRIGSPTDPARVEKDRPLECALCHADRSVGDLVSDMERMWGKRYDRGALARLYGRLDVNCLIATVDRGKPHEQAPAMAVLGEQRVSAALVPVARQLMNPIPLVRYYAQRAVDAIRGVPCAIDLNRTTPEIAAAAARCVPGVAAGGSVAPPRSGARAATPVDPNEDAD